MLKSNSAVSRDLRKLRKAKGVSLRWVARKMKFSAAYLSDLERGNRAWNHELVERYKAIVLS